MADKITSIGKPKEKEKTNEAKETDKIYIPPEKRQQIIDDLVQILFSLYKNGISKNCKLS